VSPARRLFSRATPYRAAFAASVVAAVIGSTLDGVTLSLLIPFLRLLFGADTGIAAVPTTVERVLDWLTAGLLHPGDRAAALRNVVLLILGMVAVKNAALYAASAFGQYVQEGVARDLRTDLYAALQRLGLDSLTRMKSGQLSTRIVADADAVKDVVGTALVNTVQRAALVVVYLAILFSLAARLTLVTLALAPIVVLVTRPILRRVRAGYYAALESRGELAAEVAERLDGARLVKAHGAERYERGRFAELAGRHFRAMLSAQRWAGLASPMSETLGAGVIVLLLVLASGGAIGGTASRPEMFMAFLVVSLRLLPPVKGLAQFPAAAAHGLGAARRVFELLDRPAEDVDPPDARPFPGLADAIVLRDVWVRYEGERWALHGIDLRIERGEVVALVGPSGAGKSTLADLLPRFVEPSRGEILMDGVPLSRFSRRTVRRAMGIVSQHTVLFHDTVRHNIAYGEEAGASDRAVEETARAANAHGFIERLPNGYDTIVGERGMRLSGGERQRIAIARALLRDPPILILDEATSNLDPESERLVQGAILHLLRNRTVLIIAHRLSTVAHAHRIVVLDGGRIVEQGRHDDLIRAGGVYQRLHTVEPA
jgi:subfamily B ATP-binding cassette protein MsbA